MVVVTIAVLLYLNCIECSVGMEAIELESKHRVGAWVLPYEGNCTSTLRGFCGTSLVTGTGHVKCLFWFFGQNLLFATCRVWKTPQQSTGQCSTVQAGLYDGAKLTA
jgi:hypothetical protein